MGFEDLKHGEKIDDTDLKIIKILNEDGRASFSHIAKALGVSPGMIRSFIAGSRNRIKMHVFRKVILMA